MTATTHHVLTQDALLLCKHVTGKVSLAASQHWVSVESRPVLVDSDPENRSIEHCSWSGPGVKPCQQTLKVVRGYSTFVSVDGAAVCLDTLTGFTESLPPVTYDVKSAGQALWGIES